MTKLTEKTGKYVVSIAFNYGRDEDSRIVVSMHTSPRAAIKAWEKSRNDNGWSPRIACCDDAASAELRKADTAWWRDHSDAVVVAR